VARRILAWALAVAALCALAAGRLIDKADRRDRVPSSRSRAFEAASTSDATPDSSLPSGAGAGPSDDGP
jgi:hypothetical protein